MGWLIGTFVVVALLVLLWFLLPPGIKTKLCYLCGFTLKKYEDMRFSFVPAHPGGERTDMLIVSFAGGALKIGGHSQPEFQRALAFLDSDQLYLVDPTGMSWYLRGPTGYDGIEFYERKLREILSHYKSSIFIGNCMGASAALFYSHLATKVDKIIQIVKSDYFR